MRDLQIDFIDLGVLRGLRCWRRARRGHQIQNHQIHFCCHHTDCRNCIDSAPPHPHNHNHTAHCLRFISNRPNPTSSYCRNCRSHYRCRSYNYYHIQSRCSFISLHLSRPGSRHHHSPNPFFIIRNIYIGNLF